MWIGGRTNEVSGTFRWLSDNAVVTTPFQAGEPNEYKSDIACLVLYTDGVDGVGDSYCYGDYAPICQLIPSNYIYLLVSTNK